MTLPDTARPRGVARREALLEAVLHLVAEVGADAVTHRRVAEVAGLPLASTTYWFDSKEQMLLAALELAAERDIARLHEFVAGGANDSADPASLALGAVLQSLTGSDEGRRGSMLAAYTLTFEAARRPVLRDVVKGWSEEYVTTIATLLKVAGAKDPNGDAVLLLAAADGFLIGQLAMGADEDPAPCLGRLLAALLAGS